VSSVPVSIHHEAAKDTISPTEFAGDEEMIIMQAIGILVTCFALVALVVIVIVTAVNIFRALKGINDLRRRLDRIEAKRYKITEV
jgi:hypothetical protein